MHHRIILCVLFFVCGAAQVCRAPDGGGACAVEHGGDILAPTPSRPGNVSDVESIGGVLSPLLHFADSVGRQAFGPAGLSMFFYTSLGSSLVAFLYYLGNLLLRRVKQRFFFSLQVYERAVLPYGALRSLMADKWQRRR